MMCCEMLVGDFHFGLRGRPAAYIPAGEECNWEAGHNAR